MSCDPPRRSGPVRGGVSGDIHAGPRPGVYCPHGQYDPAGICHGHPDGIWDCAVANRAPVAPPATEWNDIAPHFDHDDDTGAVSLAAINDYDPFGRVRPHTPDSARFPIGQRTQPIRDRWLGTRRIVRDRGRLDDARKRLQRRVGNLKFQLDALLRRNGVSR